MNFILYTVWRKAAAREGWRLFVGTATLRRERIITERKRRHHHLRQGGYVLDGVRLSVCLSVCVCANNFA